MIYIKTNYFYLMKKTFVFSVIWFQVPNDNKTKRTIASRDNS